MTDIPTELDALALSLLEHCKGLDVPADLKVDIFKVVAQFHLGSARTKKRDTDATGTTFASIVQKLNGTHEGGTA